jgi:gamma-glutamyltranspeptidase/glutathione hydrolase
LQPVLAQDRDDGRSMVGTGRGIVATSQVLASQAGAHMLERGGSAIDAAIAAHAVLGVTEPMMNGIGGDLFLLYWDAKSGKLYGLNASGWAAPGLTIDFLKKQGIPSMPDDGIHRVTVPGAVVGRRLISVLEDCLGKFGLHPQFITPDMAIPYLKSSTISAVSAARS